MYAHHLYLVSLSSVTCEPQDRHGPDLLPVPVQLQAFTLPLPGFQGVLSPEGLKTITSLIYYVFLPSLIISALGTSTNGTKLIRWWFLGANVFINAFYGLAIGKVAAPLIRVPHEIRPQFVLACTIGALPFTCEVEML